MANVVKYAKGMTRKQMHRTGHQQFPGVYKPKKKHPEIIDVLSMQSMIPPVFQGKLPIGAPLYKPPKVKRMRLDGTTDSKKLMKTLMPRLRYETDRPPYRIQQFNEAENAFKSPICLLFQLNSMSASQLFALRASAAEKSLRLSFVRPTITHFLCQKHNNAELIPLCKGPMIVAYTSDPKVAPHDIKDRFDELENSKKLLLISGRIDGQLFTPADCRKIIKETPSRQQMLSELVAVLQSPVQGLLSVLSSPLSMMARLLEGRRNQLKE